MLALHRARIGTFPPAPSPARRWAARLAAPLLGLAGLLTSPAQPLRIDGFLPTTGGMDDVITIAGAGFGNNPDNLCAIVMNDDLAIPLEVLSATDTLIRARLGPVTPAAKPGPIGVALGRGGRGIFKPLFPEMAVLEPAWVWVRTPHGPEALSAQLFTPVPTPVAAGKFKPAGNPNGQPKWFFSGPPTNGMLCLFLDGTWPAPSKIRVQARAHDHERGIGRDLEAYNIELPGGGTLMDCAARICDTIRCAFMQQGMVAVNCTVTQVPGANQVKLTLSMPDGRIGWGNLNVCVEAAPPPPPPVIAAVNPPGGCENTVITILGTGFGGNPDNLCAVIMLPDQRSVPLEVLTATSNRVTARLGPLPPDLAAGATGQLMLGLGDGQRGTFRPAFFDIFVEEPVWVWRKTGPAATFVQPFAFQPCPTPPERCCFFSQPPTTDGKICLILDKPWPAYSKVRIEARAHDHQRGIGRDLRAICIRIGEPVPPGGAPATPNIQENILRCAHRICDVIVCAFRQQANLEVNCTVEIDPASGAVKVTLSLPDGRIGWGNLNVCFEEIKPEGGPVITDVVPNQGRPGDVVEIRGSGFGNCADNLCAVVMDGDVSVPLLPIQVQPEVIRVVIPPLRPETRPGPIMISPGVGRRGSFRPAFFDVFVADDVWTWEKPAGVRAAMSPQVFTPIPTPPPPRQQWFFSGPPTNGVLCLFLSNAWPASAKVTIQARAHDHQRGIGRDLTAYELHFNGGGSLLDCAHRICDSIGCAFMQQGNMAVFCQVQQMTDGRVKITLGLPDGKVGWGNLNVCVEAMDPPPQQIPVITSVDPPFGGEGTLVRVRGTNFPTDPNDVCMVAMGAPGTPNAMLSHPFDVISASATQIVGRLAAVLPGTHPPGPIMIGRGAGQRRFFQPVLPGIDVTEPVWTWNRNGNPAGMGGAFQPTPNQPNPTNIWFFSGPPTNGMLMVQISGNWPSNSVITIQARAHDHAQGIGHDLSAINIVFPGGGTLDDCALKLCDSTRCAFLQAGMNVFCQVISNGVNTRKLVMTIPGGHISWGNFNICVAGPPTPPNPPPVIVGFMPAQGGPGTLVTVRGTNFPTEPDNVCMVQMGNPGTPNQAISIPFEVVSASVTQVVGRLGAVPADAQPGPIMIGRGRGRVGTPTFAFFDVFAELPVWTWEKTGPAAQTPAAQPFRPLPVPPPPTTRWFFSGPPTTNGELCVYIDGDWPSPAKVEIQARAHDHQRKLGRDLRAICIRLEGGGSILDCAHRICDVIRCAFRQQANLEVECRVELEADPAGLTRVKLTLALPDGFIHWGNFNICVTPATPPAPVIFAVQPLVAREGDVIRVIGTNFPTDPNDICMVHMGPPGTPAGTLSTPLQVLTATPTELTARLGPIDPQAQPGPIMVAVGEGQVGRFRPAFFDVFIEDDVWTWKKTGPAGQGTQTFTPQPSGTPGQWFYSGPPTADGKLCVTLQGNWTAQSKIRIEARAHDHQRGIGRDLRALCIRLPAGGSDLDCAARICDVIRCAFMQQAGILVNCTVERVGGNVKLTLTLPDGHISWGNFNICVLGGTPAPPPVVIAGVQPQQAREGDLITINGAGFGNNPDNICAVVMNGGNAIPLQAITARSNQITARLGPVPPDAVPGQIMVGLGQGNQGRFRPAFFDVFVADDVWTWNRAGGPMGLAPGTFRPLPTPPPPHTRWFFSGPPTNGVLCLYLHGNWPDPAKVRIQARAHDHTTGQGKDLEAYNLQWGSFSMMGTGGVMVAQMDLLGCAQRICDSVACAFWQQARIQVNCEVLPVDDDTVKLVLSLPDGRIDWGNFNVCVEPATGDPGPAVALEPVRVAGGIMLNVCWPLSRADFFLQAVDRLHRPIPWQPGPTALRAEGNVIKAPVPIPVPPPPGQPPQQFFRLFRMPPMLHNAD